MSLLTDLAGKGATTLSSASNAISTVRSTLASGVNLATSGIGALSGLGKLVNIGLPANFQDLFNVFGGDTGAKTLNGVTLPLKNPLHNYASYNYVLGIGALTAEMLNHPDSTYRAGMRVPLLCKSANADPSNRVQTPYGKFDFFIDDLELKSLIGMEEGQNTNVTNIQFKIIEPYSMGMFFIAAQQLAFDADHSNWNEAPFLLSIEFRGNTETGRLDKIAGTARYIPFTFTNLSMTVTERGSEYQCTALPYNQPALSNANAKFKSDVAAKGSTVQEMLQTGEKSLQAVINKKLRDIAKDAGFNVPDEILILFPTNTSSANKSSSAGVVEKTSSATQSSASSPALQAIYSKLGVSRGGPDKNLIQETSACNAIGRSEMGFNENRKGAAPIGQDNVVYDANKKVNVRANNNVNPAVSDMKFRQDTDITNAINQVIIQSGFIDKTFDASNLSPEGYRGWWRIDVERYIIPSKENMPTTGSTPKLLVYRVVSYNVHSSAMVPPNTRAPGYDELKKQAVKEYNYIYTGKNIDVIKFDIKYQSNFMNVMSSDGLAKTQDNVTAAADGATTDPNGVKVTPMPKGNPPEQKVGVLPTIVKYIGTLTGTDKFGGGGAETQGTRAARLFHDALTLGTDMVDLNMEILGDPYFIAQSGAGNYTSVQTQFKNLNADGSVNYQNGEVDILVNFRTPIDINQTTGMYQMGGSKSAPVMQFSGLYKITNVTSKLTQGKFQQTLVGFRRPQQEATKEATANQIYSTKKTEKAPKEPDQGG